ncbi:coil containing protein [Vibrio phage 1.086.O._10N.222.51.F8]|nr:coil containing protein [Vibrio phage 1.086.O._10N.222.51.F8]
MKERVTVDISKDAHDNIQHVNFSDVVVSLRALRCEPNLDDKTERGYCAILDIEIPQEESQMNIDKVETQSEEVMQPRAKHFEVKKDVHLRDYQQNTQTEHQEEMSAFSGEGEWNGEGLPPVGVECEFEYPEGRWNKGFYHGLTASAGVEMHILEFEGGCIETFGGLTKFRKPETPQQREDRERLEAAYKLYLIRCHAVNHPITYEFNEFKSEPDAKDGWLAVVDKTNYRKGVK